MITKLLRSLLKRFLDWLKSSKTGSSLLYDIKNVSDFGGLYGHERMLADSVRMQSYAKAIKRHIKPGDVVIDLGAGTGILSFLAAKQNPKHIFAVEHSKIIKLAKQVGDQNQINNITYVFANSKNFNLTEKVDVILHDQMGPVLFNENMIENILDLKKRLLKETGRIIPDKFEFYLEPACLKIDHRTPFLWENDQYGINFGCLKNNPQIAPYKPLHYYRRAIENSAVDFYLCKATPVITFDLHQLNDSNEIPRMINKTKVVNQAGRMDGFCLYFKVIFDDEIHFDTSPLSARKNWIHFLFRTDSKNYNAGDTISYQFAMGNLIDVNSWSLSVQ